MSTTPGHAAPADRSATIDRGGLAAFDQLNTSLGTLAVTRATSYDGSAAVRAHVDGNGNGYARGIFNVDWSDGDEVWYGAAFQLQKGFASALQGQVDLLRTDNWPTDPDTTDRSGVVVWHSDGMAHLIRQKLGVEEVTLAQPFKLPEGRWFWMEIHQKLSAGAGALSEVYIDGHRVARSTRPNTYGRGVQRLRAGIVATDEQHQHRPVDVLFDRVSIRTDGPLGPAPSRRSARRR